MSELVGNSSSRIRYHELDAVRLLLHLEPDPFFRQMLDSIEAIGQQIEEDLRNLHRSALKLQCRRNLSDVQLDAITQGNAQRFLGA